MYHYGTRYDLNAAFERNWNQMVNSWRISKMFWPYLSRKKNLNLVKIWKGFIITEHRIISNALLRFGISDKSLGTDCKHFKSEWHLGPSNDVSKLIIFDRNKFGPIIVALERINNLFYFSRSVTTTKNVKKLVIYIHKHIFLALYKTILWFFLKKLHRLVINLIISMFAKMLMSVWVHKVLLNYLILTKYALTQHIRW